MGREIVFATEDGPLREAAIRPEWILEGKPLARNRVLSQSADRTAMTLVWDCTAGRFRWSYDEDETIRILEGGVTLTLPDGQVRTVGPGDVVFFPKGTQAEWTVDEYVRKLAFFRTPAPAPLALAGRAWRKLGGLLRRSSPAMSVG